MTELLLSSHKLVTTLSSSRPENLMKKQLPDYSYNNFLQITKMGGYTLWL